MKKILIIHQSAELYGSDKTLLLFLKNLNRTAYNPVVILPENGPLKDEIDALQIEVHLKPVLKLHRGLFQFKNLLNFGKNIFSSLRFLKKLNQKHHFDYVYSNTIAVLAGFLYSIIYRKKHIWHVHEIITEPKVISKIFKLLIGSNFNHKIIFNSKETQNFWTQNSSFLQKNGLIIWNGLDFEEIIQPSAEKIASFRNNIIDNPNALILCLVGRFNAQKGQLFMLHAFEKLIKNNPNIHLLLVGSYLDNQIEYYHQLQDFVKEHQLENDVTFLPFQQNIWDIWYAIDIAVVPSLCLESFGLVAVEAMYAQKPVVVTAHGGLLDIVDENKNGLLVKPHDTDDLTRQLQQLINQPHLRERLAKEGKESVVRKYSIAAHMQDFYKILT